MERIERMPEVVALIGQGSALAGVLLLGLAWMLAALWAVRS